LIEQLAQGAIVCVIIDEAQNLSTEALEEVRMISNLETEQEKLVQLILLGQPELRDKIRLPSMEQLRQRISVQYHLEPLSQEETSVYIQHRLRVASPTEPLRFKSRAMAEVYRHSGGVPRLINNLCDNALLTLYTRQQRVVTPRIVREAARDLNLDRVAGGGWLGFLDAW
jgi:general secretion pathway protein A